MSQQLDFAAYSAEFGCSKEWCERKTRQLLERIRVICDIHQHKVVADALGRKEGIISQALSGETRHRFRIDDLPWLLANDPTGELRELLWSIGDQDYSDAEHRQAADEAAAELLKGEAHRAYMRTKQSKLRRLRARVGRGLRVVGGEG